MQMVFTHRSHRAPSVCRGTVWGIGQRAGRGDGGLCWVMMMMMMVVGGVGGSWPPPVSCIKVKPCRRERGKKKMTRVDSAL